MAPLPVIAGCYRVTLNWSPNTGCTPHNILHFVSSSDDVEEIGAAIESALDANQSGMFNVLQVNFELVSLSIIPLDGTSATFIYPITEEIKGTADGQPVPANAGVISFHTNQRGPQGRGRNYIGSVGENILEGGFIGSALLPTAVAGWQSFRDDLAGGSPVINHVVASYVHEEYNPVTSYSMRAVAGTVRRRQNQLL